MYTDFIGRKLLVWALITQIHIGTLSNVSIHNRYQLLLSVREITKLRKRYHISYIITHALCKDEALAL